MSGVQSLDSIATTISRPDQRCNELIAYNIFDVCLAYLCVCLCADITPPGWHRLDMICRFDMHMDNEIIMMYECLADVCV